MSLTLGTPLSANATKVMLLGSGELGKEVLIALQRLGVETIAVDRYPNAPGQQVAHRAHTIVMSDPAQLRALIEAERPMLVVPEIEAIATAELQALEDQGVVRVIPTARAARLTMDREGIRRLAAETLGLATSPYRFCDSQAELQAAIDGGIGYPCVVKPVMSSSGKGQSKLLGPDDVGPAWAHAMAGGRVSHGRVIVEGFIDFDYEITLLTVRAQGPDAQLHTHFCEPIGHVQVSGDYVESWQPHPMPALALQRARDIARAITDDLGGQGLFGVELFVRGDEVWFSEVSPRPHDTGLVTLATQWQNEFELHARAILGLPVNTALKSPGASAVIYGGVDAAGIVFDGVAQALAEPGTELRLFGKPESFVKRRMGVALAFDADVEEARAKAKRAAACVRPRAASLAGDGVAPAHAAPAPGWRACVDVGGTKVTVGLVHGSLGNVANGSITKGNIADGLQLQARRSEPTANQGESDALARQIIAMLEAACAECGISLADLEATGVSSCGPFVMRDGCIELAAPNICGGLAGAARGLPNQWHSALLEAPLRRVLRQVRVENDGVAALEAERRWGALQGLQHCAYITWSTGIGMGLCVDGVVLRGKNGNAGHAGHTFVVDNDDALCGCGMTGDLEALVAGNAMPRRFGRSAAQLLEAAKAGDAASLVIADELCRVMGRAVLNLIVTLDLQAISIGGSVFWHHRDFLLPRLQAQVQGKLESLTHGCELRAAGLGERVGDCAALALVT